MSEEPDDLEQIHSETCPDLKARELVHLLNGVSLRLEELRKTIEQVERKYWAARNELLAIQSACNHEFVERGRFSPY